jgi:UDP-2,3-diacylglucosamine pyrophosphatase LpxH
MPLYCVSDLHACDKGPRDNFSFEGREERFENFLDMVWHDNGRLLILGDLLDWWQVPVGSAVVAYRPLLDRLASIGAKWVIGNHDNALAPLIGSPLMIDHPLFKTCCHPFVEEIGGRKFLFMHGHEGDPYCCDMNPGTGEIVAIIAGMLEDRNKGPFTRNHHAVEDEFVGTLERALTIWRTLTFQHGLQAEMVSGVEKYRIEHQADVVIYGHTHVPGRMGDYHFNTGSWARTNDTYVKIEDDGTVNVWEWLGTWPKPCNVKLG